MRAIAALCHFCEAHGPRALLCTAEAAEAAPGAGVEAAGGQEAACAACAALPGDTELVSRRGAAEYRSGGAPRGAGPAALLRRAAVRSLTCEVSWSKEGGVVYFSEGASGHVLSCTFQLADSRARGLRRWFSCVVLMRDQVQLLNMMPLFSEHMQKTAKDLQQMADKVFEADQKACPQRALRLTTGRSDFGPLRSLKQLTGEENIYHKLHVTFTRMLHAGAWTYTETLYTSRDLLSRLNPAALKGSIFAPNACTVPDALPLGEVEAMVGKSEFRVLLYCALTGIEILVKSDSSDPSIIVRALTSLLPQSDTSDNLPNIASASWSSDVTPSTSLCILEVTGNKCLCRWPGMLPAKCPTLMKRIESAMSDSKLNGAILEQHVKSLQLEWLGIARALKSAVQSSGGASEPVVKLKQVFGVTPHDELLINYWIDTFCT